MISRTGNKRQGFTLLELILVITIISVVLGLSIPSLSKKIAHASFSSLVNRAYLLLDYAASRSAIKNVIVRVEFDARKRVLFASEGDVKKKNEGDEEILAKIGLPRKMRLRLDKKEISFYPDGTSSAFEIDIRGRDNRRAVISANGIDGEITVRIK
ncbi:MAG: Tfp pilus assembly protein FimT/FimU [Candidatus Omnitrophota bacterium]